MKQLIVGLGNPGQQYLMTRHNIGFMALDRLAGRESFQAAKYGEKCEIRHRGRVYVLLKPNTFMNLSGKAVAWHLQQEKLKPDQMLVITDDIALNFGTLRLRAKGSAGGHNGLKSVQELLATADYPRLRFGVGSEFKPGKQVDYVLSDFDAHEQAWLPELLDICGKLILDFGYLSIDHMMTQYNKDFIPK